MSSSTLQAFSKDGYSQTIQTHDPTKEKEIGRVYLKGLSFTDIKVVNKMYECNSEYRIFCECVVLSESLFTSLLCARAGGVTVGACHHALQ